MPLADLLHRARVRIAPRRRAAAVLARALDAVQPDPTPEATPTTPGPGPSPAEVHPAPAPTSDEVLRAVGARLSQDERVALTASARDADVLPKVDGAGEVFDGPHGRTQRMFNGIEVPHEGYVGPWMADLITQTRGHHEPQEELVFARIVERLADESVDRTDDHHGPVLIELGCYWAFYTAWFLRDLPGAVALACEPDPEHLDVGRATAAINGVAPIFVSAAAGGRDGDVVAIASPDDPTVVHEAEVRTVPSLVADHDLDRVDVLHLDVQGAELAVLETCRGLIDAGRVRFVVVSTHHHTISGEPDLHARVLDLLLGLGAHVIAEHTVLESHSGDGLVVASFDERDVDLVVPVSRARTTEALFPTAEAELARFRAAYDALHSRVHR